MAARFGFELPRRRVMEASDLIASLKVKHAELEEAIELETRRPLPDAAAISDLKKRKLLIKDRIAQLSHP
jgi:hypothetical protein